MVEKKAKRPRGRPRKRPVEMPRPVIAAAFDEAAGNGRDETEYAPEPGAQPEERVTTNWLSDEARAEFQPTGQEPPAKPSLPDLFIHRVENGYILRPAYPQGTRQVSTDARTWVVTTKEQLADLVLELIAPPLAHAQPLAQPLDFFSPPLIVETAAGPVG
jgi:hypothetical protein